VLALGADPMIVKRSADPRIREARFYSVKGMNTLFCFICLTLSSCVVYRTCMFAIKRI